MPYQVSFLIFLQLFLSFQKDLLHPFMRKNGWNVSRWIVWGINSFISSFDTNFVEIFKFIAKPLICLISEMTEHKFEVKTWDQNSIWFDFLLSFRILKRVYFWFCCCFGNNFFIILLKHIILNLKANYIDPNIYPRLIIKFFFPVHWQS